MIEKPLIVLGAPRSGTTILFRCLALHPHLWHLPSESHALLEGPLHPARCRYASNRCTAADLEDEAEARALRDAFYEKALNLNVVWASPHPLLATRSLTGRLLSRIGIAVLGKASQWSKPDSIRLLEKTPKNCLRVPLLNRLFPDAYFLWLRRKPEKNIDSLMAGWFTEDRIGPIKRARFAGAGYALADQLQLQDYAGKMWKFALVPGWQQLKGQTIADVAAWQYYQCNHFVSSDLAQIGKERVFTLNFEHLLREPVAILQQVLSWAGLTQAPAIARFAEVLPRVNDTRGQNREAGLRYPEAVYAAMDALPELGTLASSMGYPDTRRRERTP